MAKQYDYDAIIIGAGISGLVCGCYLSKAGLKTLIIEKNASVGGYCTSFNRRGYLFDACVHGLSSLRHNGILKKVTNELGLAKNIRFLRHNPSDIIYADDLIIRIFNESTRTINEFARHFPDEKKQLQNFFTFIKSGVFSTVRNQTYNEFLDTFFNNPRLKALFSIIVIELLGYNCYHVSAMVACLLLREFILDGGYYPTGGIQDLPECLAKTYKSNGGTLLLNTDVRKISIINNSMIRIRTNLCHQFSSKYTIAACDLKQTFFELLNNKQLKEKKLINTLKPSLSAFIVYIGMRYDHSIAKNLRANLWILSNLNLRTFLTNLNRCKNDAVVITSPTIKRKSGSNNYLSLSLATIVPYQNRSYWNRTNRNRIELHLIKVAEKIFPGLSKKIEIKFNATPMTLYTWTRNYKGAAYGWAGISSQFGNPDISQKTKIPNLFITGHWSNLGSGIASVVNCSRTTACHILQKERKNL